MAVQQARRTVQEPANGAHVARTPDETAGAPVTAGYGFSLLTRPSAQGTETPVDWARGEVSEARADRHLRALTAAGIDTRGHGMQCLTRATGGPSLACTGSECGTRQRCPCCGLEEAHSFWCSRCHVPTGIADELPADSKLVERMGDARRNAPA